MDTQVESDTVTTRFCIISDTHNQTPFPSTNTKYAYRQPFPSADVLLHAGDTTMTGRLAEYRRIMEALKAADAELKIVIAGNHDITLHEEYYSRDGRDMLHRGKSEDVLQIKELWKGEAAREAGIVYLEEGTRTFDLRNGARFTVYTSPWQPEFYNWAFNYHRNEDRFNPGLSPTDSTAANPIPSWPAIDIMLTHGPPYKILDRTNTGEDVGCKHLLRAVERCRPRLHCFGHIHESWGAVRKTWSDDMLKDIDVDEQKVMENRSAQLDLSRKAHQPLRFGEETVFVNASIMTVDYEPRNAPWVANLDLPLAEQASKKERSG